MDTSKKVKAICALRGVKLKDLATMMDKSYQALNQQMVRNDFKESTLREIAELLDCDLKIEFIPRGE